MTLLDRTKVVLDRAVLATAGTAEGHELATVRARLDEPLRVAVAGRVKAGKSTLLNALLDAALAPTDAGECTRVVTWYRYGDQPSATAWPTGHPPVPLAFRAAPGALDVDLGGLAPADLDQVVVTWPSPELADLTWIDTPGIDSVDVSTSARAWAALVPDEGGPGVADAVVYLLQHLHATDVGFLEAFQGGGIVHPSPVHCVGVLARGDEVGLARLDAMSSAGRVAARYAADPRVRRLCQTVVPVAALVAQGARTLSADDVGALSAISQLPDDVLGALLLSADHFADEVPAMPAAVAGQVPGQVAGVPVSAALRGSLLDRLGLFGVRVALASLRTDPAQRPEALAAHLVAVSGLDHVREVLRTGLRARRDVLKVRAALASLDDAVARYPAAIGDQLAGAVEALRAGAHELAEARLLEELRAGAVDLRDDEVAWAERLLGGDGMDPEARLGLDPGSGADTVREAALAEVARWQRRAAHPFTNRATADAARVLARSCEALVPPATR